MHPLLITAVFVYEFLSIHPYQDGNERLSRLLTTLLLMQQDYKFIQYVSFENIIEIRKDDYYKALMDGQKNSGKATAQIDKWILFFVECIVQLAQRLAVKYNTYSMLEKGLNERQQKIVQFIKKQKKAQIKDIAQALTAYSRNTLKKDIIVLVSEGMILKTGEGRGVTYHIRH
jgi:Fic family protein